MNPSTPIPQCNRVLEIRTYQLKPGSGAAFHDLVAHQSVPLLRAWGMDVVRFGPSAHDPDCYVLLRAFRDMADLTASQDAFYASSAWRQGPREAIVSCIASDANAVLCFSRDAIEAMRTDAMAA